MRYINLRTADIDIDIVDTQWRIQMILLEGEGVVGVMPPAGVQGKSPPRSRSINAFCVMVKAFS